MLDYICKMRAARGTLRSDAIAVSTIVSTVMIDAIAAHYGISIVRTLTGFKYIGNVLNDLASKGELNRYVLGFEESYGYCPGTHVRDKDSIGASMIICQMAQHYKKQGMNLVDAIEALYQRYGYYRNRTISIAYPGADGARSMAKIMDRLHSQPPADIAGHPVEAVVDYANGYKGLPKANVVEFQLPDTNKVIIRPSGTEPKIKAYLFAKAPAEADADALLDVLEAAARSLLQA
jgi:phosphoglucomutase